MIPESPPYHNTHPLNITLQADTADTELRIKDWPWKTS